MHYNHRRHYRRSVASAAATMASSERKSFCIESLLSREVAEGGGRRALSPATLTFSHEAGSSPGPSPPHSPQPPPHSLASPALLGRASGVLGTGTVPLMPPHLYQYPVPPALFPAAAFPPGSASPLLDAQALSALKNGAAALPPAALDWFARAGLMYPRLHPDLAGKYTAPCHTQPHLHTPVQSRCNYCLSLSPEPSPPRCHTCRRPHQAPRATCAPPVTHMT